MTKNCISISPDVCNGRLVITGTRITVQTILEIPWRWRHIGNMLKQMVWSSLPMMLIFRIASLFPVRHPELFTFASAICAKMIFMPFSKVSGRKSSNESKLTNW